MQVEQVASPNFNDRKQPVDMLVLHYTGMETGEAALTRMCDTAAEVSAHYMVWEDGRITQLVSEDQRAWHAGVSIWQGDTDLNSRSVGIEIVNGGHDVPLTDGTLPPYTDSQIEALIALCTGILSRHTIPASRIVAHSDIAPARKTDPGEHFPWARLAAAGIGLWPSSGIISLDESSLMPGDSGPAVNDLQNMLGAIGYGLEETGHFDETTRLVISAFQRRYVPDQITGAADPVTQERVALVYGLCTGAV